jgi:hypothetical protein
MNASRKVDEERRAFGRLAQALFLLLPQFLLLRLSCRQTCRGSRFNLAGLHPLTHTCLLPTWTVPMFMLEMVFGTLWLLASVGHFWAAAHPPSRSSFSFEDDKHRASALCVMAFGCLDMSILFFCQWSPLGWSLAFGAAVVELYLMQAYTA